MEAADGARLDVDHPVLFRQPHREHLVAGHQRGRELARPLGRQLDPVRVVRQELAHLVHAPLRQQTSAVEQQDVLGEDGQQHHVGHG